MRRGADSNLPNRFESIRLDADPRHLAWEEEFGDGPARRRVEYLTDSSRSIVSENRSPDIPFRYSINPYRGCVHGCSYCYARPWHEYLGMSAGLDFETRIVVKPDAPDLFRRWLARPGYLVEPVCLSGITDPWQPCERRFRLSRRCLNVALACCQPMFVITKNAMIARDRDLLGALAARNLVRVTISVTTLDRTLAMNMEPGTSTPSARLRAIGELADAGIPVVVNVAPVIPGLTDHEIPGILRAVSDAGASAARCMMLRLNGAEEVVFTEWLRRCYPGQADKVLERVKTVHGGSLSNRKFGQRMSGSGVLAKAIRDTFRTVARRYGLDRELPPVSTESFFRPCPDEQADQHQRVQKRLF